MVVWPCEWWCVVWWQQGGGGFFFFPRWLVVVVCLYLEVGGCLHFQRSNLAKHLKMFSIKIFYSKIFYM